MIWVSESTVNEPAGVPAKLTEVVPSNPVPVIVTPMPPARAPAVGEMVPQMQDLLDGPPAVLRMMPLRLSLQETVLSDEFEF